MTWTRAGGRIASGLGGVTNVPALAGPVSAPVIAYPTGPTALFLNGEPTVAVSPGGSYRLTDISEAVGAGLAFGSGCQPNSSASPAVK